MLWSSPGECFGLHQENLCSVLVPDPEDLPNHRALHKSQTLSRPDFRNEMQISGSLDGERRNPSVCLVSHLHFVEMRGLHQDRGGTRLPFEYFQLRTVWSGRAPSTLPKFGWEGENTQHPLWVWINKSHNRKVWNDITYTHVAFVGADKKGHRSLISTLDNNITTASTTTHKNNNYTKTLTT